MISQPSHCLLRSRRGRQVFSFNLDETTHDLRDEDATDTRNLSQSVSTSLLGAICEGRRLDIYCEISATHTWIVWRSIEEREKKR